jgi:hypothetical protein
MKRPPSWAFVMVIAAYMVVIPFARLPGTEGQTPFEIAFGLCVVLALCILWWATPALDEREDRGGEA